jgi:hypothetical protein
MLMVLRPSCPVDAPPTVNTRTYRAIGAGHMLA